MSTDLAVIEAALKGDAKLLSEITTFLNYVGGRPDSPAAIHDRGNVSKRIIGTVLAHELIAELVERVKAAEAEVDLERSYSDADTQAAIDWCTRALNAEATIASVRELADEHPGTAWNSGLNLRQALRDALGVKVTRFTSANGPGLASEDTPAPAEPVEPTCGCRTCNPDARRMVVCGLCGNKRCPHAWHHDYRCTESNEPNQEPQPILRPTDQRYEPPAVDDCQGCCR